MTYPETYNVSIWYLSKIHMNLSWLSSYNKHSSNVEETIIEDLGAGNYTIVITDNNGDMITEDVIINTNAPLLVTYSVTEPTCYYRENGRIDITDITGGSCHRPADLFP